MCKGSSIVNVLISGLFLVVMHTALAQSDNRLSQLDAVTDAELIQPNDEDWLIWRRTYDAQGFSPLTEINKSNVVKLKEAWRAELQQGPNMATPLVHDGVMFLASTQDTVIALDATTGEELWAYEHRPTAFPSPKIGIALHGELIIVPTQNMRVLALEAKTGKLIWDHKIETKSFEDAPLPYSLRGAPLVADGMVLQGVTATMIPEGGFIIGLDLESGEEVWRFHSIARPDEPGGNTWNNLSLQDRSGGSVWVPASYDPELDLAYYGTAPTYDTAPLLHSLGEDGVSNEALYTNATIALRPKSGELVWYFQHMPNDQWDLDWVFERQIIELDVSGVSRKVVLTAGKMALYDILDAATGEYLNSFDVGIQNIVTDIDPETGDKVINPRAIPNAEDANLLCPMANAGRNWPSASINPDKNMLYLPLSEVCMMFGPTSDTRTLLSTGVTITPQPMADSDGKFGRIQAIDLNTGEMAWNFREVVPPVSAMLSTGGGLVFVGTLDNRFVAFDETNGDILWESDLGDIPASFPISYGVDGKQYIALVVGQPSVYHATVLRSYVNEFLGDQSPLIEQTRSGPALVVYALD
tara:strand:- start:3261 stop:5009 length:1749 start_codon:yes stop_codon:yes gene_type:complete